MTSIRNAETQGLRISPTVVLEDPSRLDQTTLQSLCLAAQAVEEKHYADLEEKRTAQFNGYLNKIASAKEKDLRIVLIEIIEIVEKIGKPPEAIVSGDLAAKEARQTELLQEKADLENQLNIEKEKLQTAWPEAQAKAGNLLQGALEEKKEEMLQKMENALGAAPGAAQDLGKKLQSLNEEAVDIVQSRPSIPDMIAKQQGAYDAAYHDQIEGNGKTPQEAAKAVAKLAEERHVLMGQIRVAAAAREKFKDEEKDMAAAVAYTNALPSDYQEALYPENREAVDQIIDLEYKLKANAENICENTQEIRALYESSQASALEKATPTEDQAFALEQASPSEDKEAAPISNQNSAERGIRLAARTIAQFLERNENRAEAQLEQEAQSTAGFRPA